MSTSRNLAGYAKEVAGAFMAAAATRTAADRCGRNAPRVGYDCVHAAIDDHSRLAYAEIHRDETAATCSAFLRRAASFFAAHGINRIERVMTDNALAYTRSRAWRTAITELGAQARSPAATDPRPTAKAERFNRTMLDEWAYKRPYTSNTERITALTDWLHTYNHHRSHTAIGDQPPITRVNNPAGSYT